MTNWERFRAVFGSPDPNLELHRAFHQLAAMQQAELIVAAEHDSFGHSAEQFFRQWVAGIQTTHCTMDETTRKEIERVRLHREHGRPEGEWQPMLDEFRSMTSGAT